MSPVLRLHHSTFQAFIFVTSLSYVIRRTLLPITPSTTFHLHSTPFPSFPLCHSLRILLPHIIRVSQHIHHFLTMTYLTSFLTPATFLYCSPTFLTPATYLYDFSNTYRAILQRWTTAYVNEIVRYLHGFMYGDVIFAPIDDVAVHLNLGPLAIQLFCEINSLP